MGKRLIPKRVRAGKGRIAKPDAIDFSGIESSPITGNVSDDAGITNNDERESIGDSGTVYSDPADYSGADTGVDTGTRRRRGRPAGSGKASRKSTAKTQETLTGILFSLHMMGAAFIKEPCLMISEEESAQLAAAVARVQDEYEIAILSSRQQAWIQLGIAATTIYGPRVVAISNNRKQKKRASKPTPLHVVAMPEVDFVKANNVQSN